MENLKKSIITLTAGVFAVFVLVAIMSLPTMWLWNSCLVPAVAGVNEISLFQAFGITFLSSILFKNITPNSNDK